MAQRFIFIVPIEISGTHSLSHETELGVALCPADREAEMTHAKPRVSTSIAVGRRTSEVLGEEHGQPLPWSCKVDGVHRRSNGSASTPS